MTVPAKTVLKVEQLNCYYGPRLIISDVSLEVQKGEFIGIIGPNGCGKTTLLKHIYGALKVKEGRIALYSKDMRRMTRKQAAIKMAVVGQENGMPFNFSVEEIVFMGRTPHKKLLEGDSLLDKEIVMDSLEKTGMADQREREYAFLSGGEKQRVIIARALAQQPELLILDEPTNHLDICYQLGLLDLLKALRITTLAAIHDLNLAALFCDRIYVLFDKKIKCQGVPPSVLTGETIRDFFSVNAIAGIHPASQRVNLVYLPDSLNQINHT